GLNPTNCDVATASVEVVAAAIVATNDPLPSVNGATGSANAGNVLTNDLLNGVQATLDKVTITPPTTGSVIAATGANTDNPNTIVPELDPTTGIVSVPAGTPADTYTIPYEICEVLNPGHCATAFVTIVVTIPDIVASDDTYGPVRGDLGNTNLGNILPNDRYNGRTPTVDDVAITPGAVTIEDTANPGTFIPATGTVPEIDPATGIVSVPENTPDGIYKLLYTICDKINVAPMPTNCKTAEVTVTVGLSTIDAIDDLYTSVNGKTGTTTPLASVLGNDLLNGTGVVLNTTVTLNPIGLIAAPTDGSITMNADGTIEVAAGTTAGTYQYRYEICEVLNPTNCDRALATIVVTAAPILADNDSFGPFNGA